MKRFISYIVCILLVIAITLASLLYIFSNTVLNENYILETLENNNYYEKTYDNIKAGFSQYIMQSGLEENVVDNLYTNEQVKQDVNTIISNVYSNKNQKIDTIKIKANLESNIEEYLENNKITLNTSQRKSVDKFVDTIEKTYVDEISYSSYLDKIGNKVYRINQIIKKVNPIIYGAILALVVLIIIINIKQIYLGINYIGIAILASGLINIISKIYINKKVNISKILLINEDISSIIINILNKILYYIQNWGLIMIGVGLIILILTNIIKSKRMENEMQ